GEFQAMLDEADCTLAELDAWAVGRGPGNYSGLRTALTVAQAVALPDHTPVYAISSGEVLAAQTAREHPEARHIAVVGDARRSLLWFGLFSVGDNGVEQSGEWSLKPVADLMQDWPAGTRVVSSDWSRIREAVQPFLRDEIVWIPEDRYPSATLLAECAQRKTAGHIPIEPLSPIYLHPPVALLGG
ncbi:MAG: tRNA (adenosine(37)-N6)-threonylcarbamoyltransferase complex dimerization subunit type 1 TsaB, partial [Spartobacteria bacterium]|nr:tRNA (adenosine(37)-N6)-threonylcarbamoyltransferase complex dimerization subunit type 1 TsaB [Spartobacteria bacterium]